MWTILIIIILILLGAGIYIGYRISQSLTDHENEVLKKEIHLLNNFSEHWAREATDKYELTNKIARQQQENLTSAMQNFTQLMQSLKQTEIENTNQEERRKIETAIKQIKDNF
jgi:predicted negative regulator of RcsB-dependent stress response